VADVGHRFTLVYTMDETEAERLKQAQIECATMILGQQREVVLQNTIDGLQALNNWLMEYGKLHTLPRCCKPDAYHFDHYDIQWDRFNFWWSNNYGERRCTGIPMKEVLDQWLTDVGYPNE
jgi:hypothetical protein